MKSNAGHGVPWPAFFFAFPFIRWSGFPHEPVKAPALRIDTPRVVSIFTMSGHPCSWPSRTRQRRRPKPPVARNRANKTDRRTKIRACSGVARVSMSNSTVDCCTRRGFWSAWPGPKAGCENYEPRNHRLFVCSGPCAVPPANAAPGPQWKRALVPPLHARGHQRAAAPVSD